MLSIPQIRRPKHRLTRLVQDSAVTRTTLDRQILIRKLILCTILTHRRFLNLSCLRSDVLKTDIKTARQIGEHL